MRPNDTSILTSPANTVTSKACPVCGETKRLDDFEVDKRMLLKRHSYCRKCNRMKGRESYYRTVTPAKRRKWQMKKRYGISVDDWDSIYTGQQGRCAICEKPPARPVLDHNHATGTVRGILCHPCNTKLHAVENIEFRNRAIAYLDKHQCSEPEALL